MAHAGKERTMKIGRVVGGAAALTSLVVLAALPLAGQTGTGLTTYHVQGNVWVIAGAGGNITVQASNAKAAGPGAGEGVLLVDTGRKEMTAAVLAELAKIAPGSRIEYIVTTHVDADHVGGHETFAKPRMDYLWTPGTVTGAGRQGDRAGERAAAHEQRAGGVSGDRVADEHLLVGAAEDLSSTTSR